MYTGGSSASTAAIRANRSPSARGAGLSATVPNGQALDSDKFVYKMRWLDRLHRVFETQEDAASKLASANESSNVPSSP